MTTAALIAAIDRLAAAVEMLAGPPPPIPPDPTPCPRCAGKGEFAPGVRCVDCDGSGYPGIPREAADVVS